MSAMLGFPCSDIKASVASHLSQSAVNISWVTIVYLWNCLFMKQQGSPRK